MFLSVIIISKLRNKEEKISDKNWRLDVPWRHCQQHFIKLKRVFYERCPLNLHYKCQVELYKYFRGTWFWAPFRTAPEGLITSLEKVLKLCYTSRYLTLIYVFHPYAKQTSTRQRAAIPALVYWALTNTHTKTLWVGVKIAEGEGPKPIKSRVKYFQPIQN